MEGWKREPAVSCVPPCHTWPNRITRQRLLYLTLSRPGSHTRVQAGQHLDDAHEERPRLPASEAGAQAATEDDVHDRGAFGGAAAGDAVKACLIGRRESPS